MLARALLLLPVLLASALAQPIPTSSTTSECSPLLALLSNAAGVIGLELPICAQSPPASSTTTTTNTQHAEPAYPESHYDDMDNPADYGDWPLLPDWRETENKEGNISLDVDDWSATPTEALDRSGRKSQRQGLGGDDGQGGG